jgi:hypothetical protein
MEEDTFARRILGWGATTYGGLAGAVGLACVGGSESWPGPHGVGLGLGLAIGAGGAGVGWLLLHWRQSTPDSRAQPPPMPPTLTPTDDEIVSLARTHCSSLRQAIEIIQKHRAALPDPDSMPREQVSAVTIAMKSEYNEVKVDVLASVRMMRDLELAHKYQRLRTNNVVESPFEWPPVFPWRGRAADAIEAALAEWQRIEADPSRYRRLHQAAS